jgi:5-methyltetrahydrofolate--homocysteine methyltransferase
LPVSSVSGWYFAHPKAKYFGLGKISKEQVEDLITRRGGDLNKDKIWYNSIIQD